MQDPTDNAAKETDNQRSDQDRRERDRRQSEKGFAGNERRADDDRRSWIGRRQAADWRKES